MTTISPPEALAEAPRLLTVRQAAARIGVSKFAILAAIRDGYLEKITITRAGRVWYVRQADLDALARGELTSDADRIAAVS